MTERSKCIIITPTIERVERATEDQLRKLNAMGYAVHVTYGSSSVNLVRSQLASMALKEGFEEIFWIDHDVTFQIEDFERIRNYDLPIACGVYCFKTICTKLMMQMPPGDHKIILGKGGGLTEVEIAPLGFFYSKRKVYEDIRKNLALPDCRDDDGKLFTPYFLPFTVPFPDGTHAYLIDDGAFCTRARQCGYKVLVDTSIRLGHIGKYEYSWEEITDKKTLRDSLTVFLHQNWNRDKTLLDSNP